MANNKTILLCFSFALLPGCEWKKDRCTERRNEGNMAPACVCRNSSFGGILAVSEGPLTWDALPCRANLNQHPQKQQWSNQTQNISFISEGDLDSRCKTDVAFRSTPKKLKASETDWCSHLKWKYTHTKNRSGQEVKEVASYEDSGFKTITMLVFVTFLPSYHGNSFYLIVSCRCIW